MIRQIAAVAGYGQQGVSDLLAPACGQTQDGIIQNRRRRRRRQLAWRAPVALAVAVGRGGHGGAPAGGGELHVDVGGVDLAHGRQGGGCLCQEEVSQRGVLEVGRTREGGGGGRRLSVEEADGVGGRGSGRYCAGSARTGGGDGRGGRALDVGGGGGLGGVRTDDAGFVGGHRAGIGSARGRGDRGGSQAGGKSWSHSDRNRCLEGHIASRGAAGDRSWCTHGRIR